MWTHNKWKGELHYEKSYNARISHNSCMKWRQEGGGVRPLKIPKAIFTIEAHTKRLHLVDLMPFFFWSNKQNVRNICAQGICDIAFGYIRKNVLCQCQIYLCMYTKYWILMKTDDRHCKRNDSHKWRVCCMHVVYSQRLQELRRTKKVIVLLLA